MFYLVTIVIKTQIFKCKKFDEFPSTFMRQKTKHSQDYIHVYNIFDELPITFIGYKTHTHKKQ